VSALTEFVCVGGLIQRQDPGDPLPHLPAGLITEDLMKDYVLIFHKNTEKDMLLFLNDDLWTHCP